MKAVEWYKEEDGPEVSSPIDTTQSGDVYRNDTVCPKRLED
jgi:hypothetical protein